MSSPGPEMRESGVGVRACGTPFPPAIADMQQQENFPIQNSAARCSKRRKAAPSKYKDFIDIQSDVQFASVLRSAADAPSSPRPSRKKKTSLGRNLLPFSCRLDPSQNQDFCFSTPNERQKIGAAINVDGFTGWVPPLNDSTNLNGCSRIDNSINSSRVSSLRDDGIMHPPPVTRLPITPSSREFLLPSAPSFLSRPIVSTKPKSSLPSIQNHVLSSIPGKWHSPSGKALDHQLYDAVTDEHNRNTRNGSRKERRIDLNILAKTIWRLLSVIYFKRWIKTRAQALVLCLFRVLAEHDPDNFCTVLIAESTTYLKKEKFQAWKYQRTIDLCAAGGLNYKACDNIRFGVEELPKGAVGITPSGTAIANTAKSLEKHAVEDFGLGIQYLTNSHGPTLMFDFDVHLRMLLDGFGLSEFAETGSSQKPVLIAHTLDGAQLTANFAHLTGGVKIVDPRAKDPVTGIPLCIDGHFQSRDLCFPCQMTFAKDSKDCYGECFKDFFDFFNGGIVVPALPHLGLPELSNFEVVSPQDLSSVWKTTGLGGGSYSTRLFCPSCMCQNTGISQHKVGSLRCSLCQRLDCDQCFCHPVIDTHKLEDTRRLLQEYVSIAFDEGYHQLDMISSKSVIQLNPNQANRLTSKLHIEYVPVTDVDLREYNKLLVRELKLRVQDKTTLRELIRSPLENRRASLREFLVSEERLSTARQTIDRHDNVNLVAEKLCIEQAIPCILHAEMRMNEKLFFTLLSQAMDRYQDGDSSTRNVFVDRVEECMRAFLQDQWKLPVKDGKKQIEPRSMTGTQGRKAVNGMKTLATVVFASDLDEKSLNMDSTRTRNNKLLQQWHEVLDSYQELIKMLCKHTDFTDEELDVLHVRSNRFMTLWVKLMDGQCITNYIHMVGAGHMHYYVSRYRNLYRFSQQGWEAMNQKIKHYYFKNTNHGGCGGNSFGEMITGDHVLPLMRHNQRYVMWRLGLGDAFFNTHQENVVEVESGLEVMASTEVVTDDDDDYFMGII